MELLRVIFEHPFLISLAVAAFGFIFLFYFITEIRSVINDLRNLRKLVEQSNTPDEITDKEIQNSQICSLLRSYKKQLKEPSSMNESSDSSVVSISEASYFFNEGELFPTGLPVYKAMPSILTGVGILMTFFGIASPFWLNFGLHGSLDLNSFERLLQGAGLAFSTSISGIFCSLIFLLFLKYYMGNCRAELNRLCVLLDEKFPVLTKEQIEIALIKSFNSLKADFKSEFAKALAYTLGQFDYKLNASIENLKKSLDESSKSIKAISETITKESLLLESHMKNGNKSFSSQITKLSATWEACEVKLDNSFRSFEKELSRLGATLGESISPLEKIIDQEKDIKDKSAVLLGQLVSATKNISSFSTQVRKDLADPLLRANNTLIEEAKKITASLQEINDNYQEFLDCIEPLNDLAEQNIENSERNHRLLEKVSSKQGETNRKLLEEMKKLNEKSEELSANSQQPKKKIGLFGF